MKMTFDDSPMNCNLCLSIARQTDKLVWDEAPDPGSEDLFDMEEVLEVQS